MIYVISKQKNIHQEARKYRQNSHFGVGDATQKDHVMQINLT